MTPEQAAGQRVRDLRKARGWSQEDLAARATSAGLRLHQTQIGKIESAGRAVRLNELAALAAVLGVTLGDLLGDLLPDMTPTDTIPDLYGDGYRAGRSDATRQIRATLDTLEPS